jgi:hypothetical protein
MPTEEDQISLFNKDMSIEDVASVIEREIIKIKETQKHG